METKKEIRRKITKIRKERDPYEWQQATEQITALVTGHPWFREASDICVYVDVQGEAGTRLIMQEAWRLGKNVWLPRVNGSQMEFYLTAGLDELTCGAYDIPEPTGEQALNVQEALMIMPGVAFDDQGHRIGYGGGYYDRYLASHPGLSTMAIAFEDQILESLPTEEHDIRPMILVTEKQIREPYLKSE